MKEKEKRKLAKMPEKIMRTVFHSALYSVTKTWTSTKTNKNKRKEQREFGSQI